MGTEENIYSILDYRFPSLVHHYDNGEGGNCAIFNELILFDDFDISEYMLRGLKCVKNWDRAPPNTVLCYSQMGDVCLFIPCRLVMLDKPFLPPRPLRLLFPLLLPIRSGQLSVNSPSHFFLFFIYYLLFIYLFSTALLRDSQPQMVDPRKWARCLQHCGAWMQRDMQRRKSELVGDRVPTKCL